MSTNEPTQLLERALRAPLRIRGKNWRLKQLRRQLYSARIRDERFIPIMVKFHDPESLLLISTDKQLKELEEILV